MKVTGLNVKVPEAHQHTHLMLRVCEKYFHYSCFFIYFCDFFPPHIDAGYIKFKGLGNKRITTLRAFVHRACALQTRQFLLCRAPRSVEEAAPGHKGSAPSSDLDRSGFGMSPAATFHAQLASIMEVLANTAVAEICELVDGGYAVLQLELSRSRKENEVLRRKLRLQELRAARASALRAAVSGTGALLPASGRPRVHLLAGCEPRRLATPAGTRGPSAHALS